jgi:hypothetical protein
MKEEHEAGTAFLDKLEQEGKASEEVIITEGCEPVMEEVANSVIQPSTKEETKLSIFMNWMSENWIHFINWIKKSISMMIIFVLLGCAGGLYLSKIIYDMRMDEIAQLAKTGVAGYVHKGQIFDVKMRP